MEQPLLSQRELAVRASFEAAVSDFNQWATPWCDDSSLMRYAGYQGVPFPKGTTNEEIAQAAEFFGYSYKPMDSEDLESYIEYFCENDEDTAEILRDTFTSDYYLLSKGIDSDQLLDGFIKYCL